MCAEKGGGLSVSGVNLQFTAVLIGFAYVSLVVFCYRYLLLVDTFLPLLEGRLFLKDSLQKRSWVLLI